MVIVIVLKLLYNKQYLSMKSITLLISFKYTSLFNDKKTGG